MIKPIAFRLGQPSGKLSNTRVASRKVQKMCAACISLDYLVQSHYIILYWFWTLPRHSVTESN